ncbi:MAG: hypothetical protein FJ009_09585 [Chloroflexi bacterium]|nr:hypothetical protein [Chloroflexota bacterium]
MQIPKKTCVIALEGDRPAHLLELGGRTEFPNLGQIIRAGTLAQVVQLPELTDIATNWVALATAHGAEQARTATIRKSSPAPAPETIWQAASRIGKSCVVQNFPLALTESTAPANLIESGNWDLSIVRFAIPDRQAYIALEQFVGRVMQHAGKETLIALIHLGMASTPSSAKRKVVSKKTASKRVRAIEGWAVLYGPGIKKGFALQRAVRINDIVPTICYLTELPVPDGADGAVLYQAFQDPNFQVKQLRTLREGLARLEKALADEPWQPWHGTGEPAF